jgi:hypothetical protein
MPALRTPWRQAFAGVYLALNLSLSDASDSPLALHGRWGKGTD